MSGFGFSEEQEMFRKMVRDFSKKELAPGAKERAKQEGDYKTAHEWAKRMAAVDLIGLGVPEKYGGQGADWVTVAIAVEEMSKADINLGAFPVLPALMAKAMELGGVSEEIRKKYLSAMCKGECLTCLSITEPNCGSDVAAIRMKAKREGDDYILNGEKTSVSGGMTADMCYLFAKTDPKAGARGVTSFFVPLDLPGITKSRFDDTGFKNVTRASIFFDDVHVPADHRLSDEGKGFYMLMGTFDVLRVFLAISVLGAAETSINEAIEYSKQRTAFGQPIARYEGVSFKIAEHATRIEAAKLLCYRTFWLADQGQIHTKEAAMSKWFCPVVAREAIHDALLIHGHVAYSTEHPLEQRLRDAIGYELADGTADIMKLVIARELIGKESRPY
ncbi:MAG: acyl-CoA dehydrogenase family protein [Thermodesulfobacteriota bacterium]|nr:acyl-CoA dehydrogenase family protein [Thermodesulfobacteriota bacterium]